MDEIRLFSVPIWQDLLKIDTKSMSETCLKLREANFPNKVLSNVGGWQSETLRSDIPINFRNGDGHNENLNSIIEIISVKLAEACKAIDPQFKCELTSFWININEFGHSNAKHIHTNSTLSGVVYLQVDDDCGKIVFEDDYSPIKHYPLKVSKNSNAFKKNVSIIPTNGMILIFPSWITHHVEPSKSLRSRISISFNSIQDCFKEQRSD